MKLRRGEKKLEKEIGEVLFSMDYFAMGNMFFGIYFMPFLSGFYISKALTEGEVRQFRRFVVSLNKTKKGEVKNNAITQED